MKIVDIYCPDCDYIFDTPEVIPGTPPSCPKCGEVHTRWPRDVSVLGGFIEDTDGVLERLLFG